METKEEYLFEKWFDGYFCNQQGEDSPYRYDDVKEAFEEAVKQERQKAERFASAVNIYLCNNMLYKEAERILNLWEEIYENGN